MSTYKNLLIHGLALGGRPKSLDDISRMTDTALSLGAVGLELVYWPGAENNLCAEDVARVMNKCGASKACVCTFQPGGDFGDPAIPELRWSALNHAKDAIRYAHDMFCNGLMDVNIVDGPLAFILGKQDYGPSALNEVVEFMKILGDYADINQITLCLERLQPSEDGVIRRAETLRSVLEKVGMPSVVRAHDDTFHAVKNDGVAAVSLRTLGNLVGHFHANGIGTDIENEGRIPCGCEHFEIDGKFYTDSIDLGAISAELAKLPNYRDLLIVLEPFCEAACVEVPPLRTGVVPVTDISQIAESVKNLAVAGMLIAAD